MNGQQEHSGVGGELIELEGDAVLAPFFAGGFSETNYVSSILSDRSLLAGSVAALRQGVGRLDEELQHQVVTHREGLLDQVSLLDGLHLELETLDNNLDALASGLSGVRQLVAEPISRMEREARSVRGHRNACELTRAMLAFLALVTKLRQKAAANSVVELLGAAQQLPWCALHLRDVDELLAAHGMLQGVHAVERQRGWLEATRENVVQAASRLFAQGMRTHNQGEVATAVLVFHNLRTLPEKVRQLLADVKSSVASCIQQAAVFSQQDPQQSSQHSSQQSQQQQVWQRLKKMADDLFNFATQVWHTQTVLAKMRDPLSLRPIPQVCLDPLDPDATLFSVFYRSLVTLLCQEFTTKLLASSSAMYSPALSFSSAASRSAPENPLVTMLATEYGRLRRIFLVDLVGRIRAHAQRSGANPVAPFGSSTNGQQRNSSPSSSSSSSSVESTLTTLFDDSFFHQNVLLEWERIYFARIIETLFSPVQQTFAAGAAPSIDAMRALERSWVQQLQKVANDSDLLQQLLDKGFVSAIGLVAAKCEALLKTGEDVDQLIHQPTAAQHHNAALFNSLMYFSSLPSRFASAFPPSSPAYLLLSEHPSLQTACSRLPAVAAGIIRPLFSHMKNLLSRILLQLHQEDFSSDAPFMPDHGGSKYLSRFQNAVQHFLQSHLALYTLRPARPVFVKQYLEKLVRDTVQAFLLHASMLRPLSDSGKLHLAGDIPQLELALQALCESPVLKPVYSQLHAFRRLIFLETSELTSQDIKPLLLSLPPQAVMSHLFSRAPAEIESPNTRAKWDIPHYYRWIQTHSFQQLYDLMQDSLSAYAKRVNARGEQSFHTIYPIILLIGKQLIEPKN